MGYLSESERFQIQEYLIPYDHALSTSILSSIQISLANIQAPITILVRFAGELSRGSENSRSWLLITQIVGYYEKLSIVFRKKPHTQVMLKIVMSLDDLHSCGIREELAVFELDFFMVKDIFVAFPLNMTCDC